MFFFDQETKDKIKKGLEYFKVWDITPVNKTEIPIITFSIKEGFLCQRYVREQKECFHLRTDDSDFSRIIPKVESYYISAKKLISNTEMALEKVLIPCELRISSESCPSTISKFKTESLYYFRI